MLAAMHTPRKGTIMTIAEPASASWRLEGESVQQTEPNEVFEAPPEMPDRPALVFELRRRSGIWEVTKDGRSYGNFLSEKEALESAQAAVRSVVAGGGFACLSDAVIDL